MAGRWVAPPVRRLPVAGPAGQRRDLRVQGKKGANPLLKFRRPAVRRHTTNQGHSMASHDQTLIDVLRDERPALLQAWTTATHGARASAGTREEADALMRALQEGLQGPSPHDLQSDGGTGARRLLEGLSASRAAQGQTAGDTSAFVLALKLPIF